MNRRQLLFSGVAASAVAALGTAQAARAGGRARRLVILFANGGWDVTMSQAPRLDDSFVEGPRVDEDPSNPDDREYLLHYGDITIAGNDHKRPSAKAFFDAWSHRVCTVNGIYTGAVGHEPSVVRLLTGTGHNSEPDLCAIVGNAYGTDMPLGYIALAGTPFVGPYAASSGQVGFNSQLKLLFDRSTTFPAPAGVPLDYPLFDQTPAEEDAVQEWLRARADRFRTLRGDEGFNTARLDDLTQSYERSRRFRDAAGDLVDTLVLGKQPSFETQAQMAASLLSRDTCAAVLLDSGSAWDTHSNNASQHENFEKLFGDLHTLMSTLDAASLLDDTLVVVMSEMTRTPKINANGGKDHWPHASVMMMGAGVRGRGTVGDYDGLMESVEIDLETGEPDPSGTLMKYDNLAAGILEHLGVDPVEHFPEAAPLRGFVA